MRNHRLGAAILRLALLPALAQTGGAQTTEVRVLSSTALKGVLEELVPQFERTTRHTVVIQYGTAASLKRKIESGEPFDLAVLTPTVMDEVIAQGKVAASTRTPIARSGMAMAIRPGARKPDISSTGALKQTLVDAKSIVYAGEGAAGVYFTALVQRLGLADVVKPKSRVTASGLLVGEAVAGGEAEIGILPISEILAIRGVEVLGTFPTDVQGYAEMVGGVAAGAKESRAANDLLRFMTAPAALPVIKKKGMERVEPETSVALTGQVTSAEEGPMEGVLISAKKAGSTITVTVVSDERGRYRFPRARLEPGQYTFRIRAVGYDLDGPGAVEITPHQTATADVKLRRTTDLASQLTNAEWLASFPGTNEQKASVRNCTHCHTLALVTRSTHDAAGFVPVLARMSDYPPLSFPLMPQKLLARRIGGGEDPLEGRQDARRRQADYLSSLNLSSAPRWGYELKTLPRPRGSATAVVYTEYDLPKRTRQPHDVILDADGMAWYASFGEQILGKLDPRTGKVQEYDVPVLKPRSPTGILGLRSDKAGDLWLGLQFQGGVAKFDRHTERFETWSLPPELNGDHVQVNQVGPGRRDVDGKVWLQDAGTYTVLRLDVASGKFETFEPFRIPRPNIYDVIPDSQNNGYFTVFGRGDLGRIDAKTGRITIHPTPTPRSGPRRGMMDSQDRLWFGENHGDRIGMFDTRTERFQEWVVPTPESWPYDVTADANGDVWAGGEFTDRVLRLDPRSGQFTEYLLPKPTNIRRVFVDNSTKPVTFWVGSNHGASIIKLEPLN